jgi:stage V sporulation protein S
MGNVDRFFSKLDLRDIKIDPFNTSFPPDDDSAVEAEETAEPAAPVAAAVPGEREWDNGRDRQAHVPAWAAVAEIDVDAAVPSAPVVSSGLGAVAAALLAEPEPQFAVDGLETSGDVLKVSARSRPSAVAGAIAGVVRERGRAEVQAIGAGATNQAVKAVAIAREYLRETGIEAVCLPSFIDVTIENEDRTAILLVVEPR